MQLLTAVTMHSHSSGMSLVLRSSLSPAMSHSSGKPLVLQSMLVPASDVVDRCIVTLDCGPSVCVTSVRGDVNNDGVTSTADASLIKPDFGDPASADPRNDFNLDGIADLTYEYDEFSYHELMDRNFDGEADGQYQNPDRFLDCPGITRTMANVTKAGRPTQDS